MNMYILVYRKWDLFKTKIAEADEGINFEFHFKRRPMFLVISIILPVMFISLLNIFVFILPQESGERVGFAITSLLSIVVFLTTNHFLNPQWNCFIGGSMIKP
jgi:hypothetical protein